ncbi:hypothetical protein RFI_21703 [Reticulomyxa filosa]|uniref:Uncharacterized protein n=1 Tax=Reticulomyxa filosa TaxID=46433 RepID=X6MRC2_RETFI|nr:hypothetical protein RFI_21703 [Reticulomyxa filosa]|eukprot:ETO15660.1 hypothetical protein RFI_21703 [Reticulomyxa filosa]
MNNNDNNNNDNNNNNNNNNNNKYYRLAVSLWTEQDCVSIKSVRMYGNLLESEKLSFDQVVDFSIIEKQEWEKEEQKKQKVEVSTMKNRGRAVSELRTQLSSLQEENETLEQILKEYQKKESEQSLQIQQLQQTIEQIQQSQQSHPLSSDFVEHTSPSPQPLPTEHETPQFDKPFQTLLDTHSQLKSELLEIKIEMQRAISSKLELVHSSAQEINLLRNLIYLLTMNSSNEN